MSLRRVRNRETGDDSLIIDNFSEDEPVNRPTRPSSLSGDRKNISILFLLYLLQGIPLGLMQAIPIILTNSGVSYKQLAQFSLVNWPFSLKLLWAPIVDSVYSSAIGRRKSWLVPCQYLIGILMLLLSVTVDGLLGETDKSEPNILFLVASFFTLNFLAATQDIAVDGWALTMLKRENVGYASTCNSVGQTAGYLFGFVAFIALESASFCNSYIRTDPLPKGIVTLPEFLQFWGWVFVIVTTLIWLLKSERQPSSVTDELSVMQSYKTLLSICSLRPIRLLAVVLLTTKIAFSAVDALSGLKLIELGVPKEEIALLAIPLIPLQILFPIYLSRKTAGPYPMEIYIQSYPYRIVCSLVLAAFVWITPSLIHDGEIPYYYYVILLVIYGVYQIWLYSMFVAQMAFYAKISDPAIGGTYMTLVNTLSNMGGNWTTTAALWMVEGLTFKQCSNDPANLCSNSESSETCTKGGGKCNIEVDGYYLEVLVCAVIGVLWYMWGRGAIRRLQSYPMLAYAVSSRSR